MSDEDGSWLNIAENELSSMTRQCVRGRRIPTIEALRDETTAWANDVNETQRLLSSVFKFHPKAITEIGIGIQRAAISLLK